MSGGSHNYLCFEGDLAPRLLDIESMSRDLLMTAGASEAQEDTQLIVAMLRAANRLAERLNDVWKAEEWYKSGDYSKEQALEAINRYGGLDVR